MNNVTFRGTVAKVYKSGFVCEIPPRTDKGFPTGVWVKISETTTPPCEGNEVIVVGSLSTSKGKSGPQLGVYAFEVVSVESSGFKGKAGPPDEDDIPF